MLFFQFSFIQLVAHARLLVDRLEANKKIFRWNFFLCMENPMLSFLAIKFFRASLRRLRQWMIIKYVCKLRVIFEDLNNHSDCTYANAPKMFFALISNLQAWKIYSLKQTSKQIAFLLAQANVNKSRCQERETCFYCDTKHSVVQTSYKKKWRKIVENSWRAKDKINDSPSSRA